MNRANSFLPRHRLHASTAPESGHRRADRLRGRGRYVARLMREAHGVEFGAVADVYGANAEKARDWAGPGRGATGISKVARAKDLDAVLIATRITGTHTTVFACQAGKDVYVEKRWRTASRGPQDD